MGEPSSEIVGPPAPSGHLERRIRLFLFDTTPAPPGRMWLWVLAFLLVTILLLGITEIDKERTACGMPCAITSGGKWVSEAEVPNAPYTSTFIGVADVTSGIGWRRWTILRVGVIHSTWDASNPITDTPDNRSRAFALIADALASAPQRSPPPDAIPQDIVIAQMIRDGKTSRLDGIVWWWIWRACRAASYVFVVLALLAMLAGSLRLLRRARYHRRLQRLRNLRCSHCNYDLAATRTVDRCPECGTDLNRSAAECHRGLGLSVCADQYA